MRLDAAAGVQVDRLEGADHGPAATEPVADDAVDVVDRDDTVSDEAVGLTEQRALEPVEDEALDLRPDVHDAHPRPLE